MGEEFKDFEMEGPSLTLSSQNTLGSGKNCRILKQGCRRFCFVIIIPYPDRKANICSIRLSAM